MVKNYRPRPRRQDKKRPPLRSAKAEDPTQAWLFAALGLALANVGCESSARGVLRQNLAASASPQTGAGGSGTGQQSGAQAAAAGSTMGPKLAQVPREAALSFLEALGDRDADTLMSLAAVPFVVGGPIQGRLDAVCHGSEGRSGTRFKRTITSVEELRRFWPCLVDQQGLTHELLAAFPTAAAGRTSSLAEISRSTVPMSFQRMGALPSGTGLTVFEMKMEDSGSKSHGLILVRNVKVEAFLLVSTFED